MEGTLHINTPLSIPSIGLVLGNVIGIKNNDKDVLFAKKGSCVSIKIDTQPNIVYGIHFDLKHHLYSKISRESIDVLKQYFKYDLDKEDWLLLVKLKGLMNIEDVKK